MNSRFTLLLATALGLCLLPWASALAQETSTEPPIEIEADMLEVDRDSGVATFSGSVHARQESFRLNANKLQVFYGEDSQGVAEITKLEASGDVFIDGASGQSAYAQWARFDVAEERITLGDKVQLLQGENIIEGGETIIDLTTGEARMGSGEGARVRGLFTSGEQLRLSDPLPQ